MEASIHPEESANSDNIRGRDTLTKCPKCGEPLESVLLNIEHDAKDGCDYQNYVWGCTGLRQKQCIFPMDMPREVFWGRRTMAQMNAGMVPLPKVELLPPSLRHLYPDVFLPTTVDIPNMNGGGFVSANNSVRTSENRLERAPSVEIAYSPSPPPSPSSSSHRDTPSRLPKKRRTKILTTHIDLPSTSSTAVRINIHPPEKVDPENEKGIGKDVKQETDSAIQWIRAKSERVKVEDVDKAGSSKRRVKRLMLTNKQSGESAPIPPPHMSVKEALMSPHYSKFFDMAYETKSMQGLHQICSLASDETEAGVEILVCTKAENREEEPPSPTGITSTINRCIAKSVRPKPPARPSAVKCRPIQQIKTDPHLAEMIRRMDERKSRDLQLRMGTLPLSISNNNVVEDRPEAEEEIRPLPNEGFDPQQTAVSQNSSTLESCPAMSSLSTSTSPSEDNNSGKVKRKKAGRRKMNSGLFGNGEMDSFGDPDIDRLVQRKYNELRRNGGRFANLKKDRRGDISENHPSPPSPHQVQPQHLQQPKLVDQYGHEINLTDHHSTVYAELNSSSTNAHQYPLPHPPLPQQQHHQDDDLFGGFPYEEFMDDNEFSMEQDLTYGLDLSHY